MRAASCLPLKNMTYLDDVKTWKFIPVEINRGYLEQPFYTVEWEMPVIWLSFDKKTVFLL
jgi:hypothetical protein